MIAIGDRCAIEIGDARDVLARLKPNTIDALVCDPPAGISFMGKEWDHDHGHRDEWIKAFASVFLLALRAMKPGAHGLVWALPRTSHWTATALEDAGFEVRDVIMHLFGTGFPKSLDVSKAVANHVAGAAYGNAFAGWGTALKPAAEHWILVRKPLDGTVAANVLAHGTGGINVDACRICVASDDSIFAKNPHTEGGFGHADAMVYGKSDGAPTYNPGAGRWPANVTLDEEAAVMLDEQSGDRQHLKNPNVKGGASRFFYVAKPGRKERDLGCEDLPTRSGGEATDREDGTDGLKSPRAGAGRGGGAKNHHPTVKAIALMRYLIRLVTPPGGVVLDPFLGSGSTGVAALAEGFGFIGVEREQEYVEIAVRRIAKAIASPIPPLTVEPARDALPLTPPGEFSPW